MSARTKGGASPAPAPRPRALGTPGRSPSSTSLGGASSSGTLTPNPTAPPRTPESSGMYGGRRSDSATPTASEDALSLASAATGTSFSSAADVAYFAPASTQDAVHAVPSLLSLLLSGRTDEQVLAARKLHAYCRHSGCPVEAAIAAAGGVHMLLIMLDSLDRSLRDLCTRILTDMAEDERVRAEILSAPGGTAKVIQLMYRGILDGQASAGRFLELLANSKDEAVLAALCHGKVVRMLCKTLGSAPTPRARGAALAALQAFCRQEPGNLRKLVWSGGCASLLGVLQSADSTPAQHTAALQLLGAAVALQADAAATLAAPEAVAALARFVGAPEAPLAQQAEAADILGAVAAVPMKRDAVRQALTDEVLPRVFEIVHEAGASAAAEAGAADADASDGASDAADATARRRLHASAAAIVGQLVRQDRECCHSILFHTQLLGPAVRMLVEGGRYAAAQELLEAARAYATSLGPEGAGGACNGTAAAPGGPARVALA